MLAHNTKMKQFLAGHGIKCTPKRIDNGSLKGTWRLYQKGERWTETLIEQLSLLGFVDLHHKPLGRFSGNGGWFCVFVREPQALMTKTIHDQLKAAGVPLHGQNSELYAKVNETSKPIVKRWRFFSLVRTFQFKTELYFYLPFANDDWLKRPRQEKPAEITP